MYVVIYFYYILFKIPMSFAMFHMNHIHGLLYGSNQDIMEMLLAFFAMDVVFNMVCEQPLEDNNYTKHIHQNVQEYLLTKRFMRDILVLFYFAMMTYLGEEFGNEMNLDRIHSIYSPLRLNDPNDNTSGFNSFTQRKYYDKHFLVFDYWHRADLFDIVKLLGLLKILDQERIVRTKDLFDELLD